MKTKLIIALILTNLVSLGLLFSGQATPAQMVGGMSVPPIVTTKEIHYPPEVIYQEVEVEKLVPYEVRVPYEVEVVKEVVKEVIVEKPLELKDWQSLAEVQEFLDQHADEIVVHLLLGRDGIAQFENQCVGWAMGLRELGVKYGKNIELDEVSPEEYRRIFGRSISDYHMVNSVIVGQKEIYYIEAQKREIKLAGYIP